MPQMKKLIFLFLFMSPFIGGGAAAEVNLKGIRTADKADGIRLVLDLDKSAVGWRAFLLDNPRRAVIDLTLTTTAIESDEVRSKHLSALRYGAFARGVFRIVLDLSTPMRIKHLFPLPAEGNRPHRLVVDLQTVSGGDFAKAVAAPPLSRNFNLKKEVGGKQIIAPTDSKQKPVIVIDAGHGGIDPGASGRRLKTKEKRITLRAAKMLRLALLKGGKYRVVLTRGSDVYLPLRKRIAVARKSRGDLFISLHADSIPGSKTAKGLSVYTLSERSSDKEAAALASRENKADIIAGLDFSDQSKEITDILIDLTQRETMNYSIKFAKTLLGQMRGKVTLLRRTHRFAGFVVLKSPEVPSVLIELGYLSDPTEEKNLRSDGYLRKLADLITRGVNIYFEEKAKQG